MSTGGRANKGVQPTAYSVRSCLASASGGGSHLALDAESMNTIGEVTFGVLNLGVFVGFSLGLRYWAREVIGARER